MRPIPERHGLRGRRIRAGCAAVAILALLPAQTAGAAQCNVDVQGVSFGTYDTFSTVPLDGVGNVSVSCDVQATYTIGLSPGAGSFLSRSMVSGAHTLAYNLYTDPTHSVVWGDGTGSTATVSGSGIHAGHPIYGRIPARQNAYVGAYSDVVIVTVTY